VWRSSVLAFSAVVSLLATGLSAPSPAAGAAPPPSAGGSFVLTAPDRGVKYAPTYTGNGYLGIRVPAAGQGYVGGTIPAEAQLAGFYAQPPGDIQQRANIPTWSTLHFGDGTDAFDTSKTNSLSRWSQQLDLRDGVISTTARWQAGDGHSADVTYRVFTDRARQYVGVVQLSLTPHWSGRAQVTDLIDGTAAILTTGVSRHWQRGNREIDESVRTVGTGITAALSSRLGVSANVKPTAVGRVAPKNRQSIGQRVWFPVQAGTTYTVTKYVGVASSHETARPAALARAQSGAAEHVGFARLHREDTAAWSQLWSSFIDVRGDKALATQVNASQFYLWSSTRSDVDWSISPAGLSSNGYAGHIFWDAETWMHPSLLALHPELARAMDAYRFQRLHAAEVHARQTGYRGARFPWESALDGTEQIPPPVSVNSEGLYEQHITADIVLAQWQYFLATGDMMWLRTRGWPVISQAATFWASRVTPGPNGSYHILHVTGPDEENPDVNDEAYTNVAAARTLTIATQAAAILGRSAPASWMRIASGLVVPFDRARDFHPEFRGYQGQLVKQADVTMLQYPWGRPMSRAVARNDLNYYVPRTDPTGPSMSDAVNEIDTSSLGLPGCAAYVYTERSILPFMRDYFDQFSETRTGGAFTFMTGIGGFLQEFLYGYSGLRMQTSGVTLDPMLNGQLGGAVLHRLAWHGRRFTVSIGSSQTTVSLDSGAPMTVRVRGVAHTLAAGAPLTVSTRRPDLTPTADLVRCQSATATSSARGEIALAAVDGSPATDWRPRSAHAALTVPLGAAHRITAATLLWGRQWPPSPAPNVPPPPGPVTTLRPSTYRLQVSTDGTSWHTVATVHDTSSRTTDRLSFKPSTASYVRVRVGATSAGQPPMLEELRVTR